MEPNSQQVRQSEIHFAIGRICTHARMDYIADHIICHIISGEMRVIESQRQTIYRAGDSFLLRRNALAKCEQRPTASGIEFKVIFMVLTKDYLQNYAIQHNLSGELQKDNLQPLLTLLKPTPSLTGLFDSLLPYINAHSYPSAHITTLKLEEFLICLQEQNAGLLTSLFTLAVHGKLDLAEFMERNYMFNVPMNKFAELSGRSLSTFQRDFIKIFDTQASQWLLKRRLKAAHALLLNNTRKPSDVYLETGFEDLSHFSRSFKKYFGYNPSKLKTQDKVLTS